jgi:sugar phosphate isomerase/epimerase
MIYVSSACVKAARLEDALCLLHQNRFLNVECSGGAVYEENVPATLKRLKDDLGLNILCHNYFPVPKESFVLNLASADDAVYQRSIDHLRGGIELSQSLGLKKFSFHAGFLMDIPVSQIGGEIGRKSLFDRPAAIDRFVKAYHGLQSRAKDVELYIENNVLSASNKERFGGNPFLLTDHEGYAELRRLADFKLLLDVGHLKVSCQSLGLDLDDELNRLMPESDYIHLSDNDGRSDQNRGLTKDSRLWQALKAHDLRNKTVTLEVYESMDAVRDSYELVKELTA